MTRENTQVGTRVDGFGYGMFGRTSFNTKVCIATGFYDETRWALFHEKAGVGEGVFTVVSGNDLLNLEAWMAQENSALSEMD